MSRLPRPLNKRLLTLLSDGKARSIDELAEALGVNQAEAIESVRSMMNNNKVCVHSTITMYGLNAKGLRLAGEYKKADAMRADEDENRQRKREYMRQKRAAEAEIEERKDADGIVAQAMASRHVLAGVWA